jgi:hypothetical protein
MSRRRRQAHAHPQQAAALFGWWTIPRATSTGIVAGIVALMMSGLLSLSGGGLLYLYVALLALTALCGASILLITLLDMRTRGTSGRMRPIRGFDVAIGLILLAPSLYALTRAWPELML